MFTFSKRRITLDGTGDGLLDAEALQSKTIDYLRFPMALAVVYIHSAGDVPMSPVHYDAFTGLDFYNLLRVVFFRRADSHSSASFLRYIGIFVFPECEAVVLE